VQISVQLYSVREQLRADPRTTLTALKDQGFTDVEPFGLTADTPLLGGLLAELGLNAPTTHASVLEAEDPSALFAAAAELGIATVIDPHTPRERWTDRGEIARIADGLNNAAAVAAQHGVRLGYHNHDHEVRTDFDGRTGLELLAADLDPAVVLEVDTYWVAVGGPDPVALLERLGDRVVAVHLKDGPKNGETSQQQPLGQGEIDVDAIIAASRGKELGVIEFDAYAGDVLEGVAASRTYLVSALTKEDGR
jgi:sugar phosphate isomerase/epimerase